MRPEDNQSESHDWFMRYIDSWRTADNVGPCSKVLKINLVLLINAQSLCWE